MTHRYCIREDCYHAQEAHADGLGNCMAAFCKCPHFMDKPEAFSPGQRSETVGTEL